MSVVSGSVKGTSSFTQTANLPGTVTSASDLQNFGCQFANGVAADQIDLNYVKTLTFVASTPQVLDLQSLVDRYGGAVSFARVKSITIKMRGATDGWALALGYATTTANAWTSLLSNPGQLFLQASTAVNDSFFEITAPNATGWAVATGNHLLNLDPGAHAYSIDIEISGCSA